MQRQNFSHINRELDRVEVPSLTPYLSLGLFCLLYAMIFPLYLWWHYLIPLVLGAGLFLLVRRFSKPRYATVEYSLGGKAPKTDKSFKYTAVCLCFVVILSILYGGVRSIKNYRETVIDKYNEGVAGKTVETVIDTAYNIITVAGRYIPNDEALEELRKSFTRSDSIKGGGGVDHNAFALIECCNTVLEKLETKTLSAQDKTYKTEFSAQLKSDKNVLLGSEHNKNAKKYNQTLKTYPAKLFAGMAGVGELPIFSAEEE